MHTKTFGFGDGVTDLTDAFRETSITSTPKMIFGRNINSFNRCFKRCSLLTSISSELLDNCPNVTDFSKCFISCESLTAIPEGLFDNCTKVTEFSYCFDWDSNITSALPDVWNKDKFPNVIYGNQYAKGCTKAANYNEIPDNFK